MFRRNEISDSVDQAAGLRDLAQNATHPPSAMLTLAILSGKGGVGKSNIAVNLSVLLACRGLRVALIDLDMGLANADVLLGVRPRFNLSHLLSGAKEVEDLVVPGPGGLMFIGGASGTKSLANLSEFERQNLLLQLRKLRGSTDIAVFDCGAGISQNVLTFAAASDRVTVVTTTEPTARADAYAAIKCLRGERYLGRVGVFVNMADSRHEAKAAYTRIAAVAKKFLDFPVADDGYMLHDRAVELAVQTRCPFVLRDPGSNAGVCVAALANDIGRSFTNAARSGGLLRRLAGLFV